MVTQGRSTKPRARGKRTASSSATGTWESEAYEMMIKVEAITTRERLGQQKGMGRRDWDITTSRSLQVSSKRFTIRLAMLRSRAWGRMLMLREGHLEGKSCCVLTEGNFGNTFNKIHDQERHCTE